MSYWRFRAFDQLLKIQEGVIIGPDGDAEHAFEQIMLQLRQQGLQGVELSPITKVEYLREQRLQRLKDRLKPSPSIGPTPADRPPKTTRGIGGLFRSLFRRKS